MNSTSPDEMVDAVRVWREMAAVMEGDVGDCPVRSVLDKVGDKWSMLLVMTFRAGHCGSTSSSVECRTYRRRC